MTVADRKTCALGQQIAEEIMAAAGDAPERLEADPAAHLQLLAATVLAAEQTSLLLQEAIDGARHAGNSWEAIGGVLGVSKQAAQQRFGRRGDRLDVSLDPGGSPRRRRLSPLTAFDEMAVLEEEGRHGWHSVDFGTLYHLVEASPWQWEHRRVIASPLTHRKLSEAGWHRIRTMWFPWAYYARQTDRPALPQDG